MYVTQGLHRSVQQNPGAAATVCGDRTQTFAQLADRVSRLAGGLRAAGVGPDDRVGYLGLNSDRYLEYYLAVPWIDAVVMPINSRWAPAETAFSMTDSDTRVLVVDDAFVGTVDELRERVPGLTTVVHAGDRAAPAGMLSFAELAGCEPVPDIRRGSDAVATRWPASSTPVAPPASPRA